MERSPDNLECGGKHSATPLWIQARDEKIGEINAARRFTQEERKAPSPHGTSVPCSAGALQKKGRDTSRPQYCIENQPSLRTPAVARIG